ncbi:CBO0543 family protein [Siminovitchia sp. 179-K 8D1 HS]|uniref:CBO0543 family protein n=1 Tax=Siminovitchia sp. 179-K 8D1 HS TaxID=3142385 RepID=UPI0039A2D84B
MKRLKTSNLPQWPKKHYPNRRPAYFTAVVFGCLIATYLDLVFAGKGLYEFPRRPFPDVFSFDVFFTLAVLPVFTLIFLYMGKNMSVKVRCFFYSLLSIAAAAFEMLAESAGLLRHAEQWHHWYSAIGYFIFLHLVWKVSQWPRVKQ